VLKLWGRKVRTNVEGVAGPSGRAKCLAFDLSNWVTRTAPLSHSVVTACCGCFLCGSEVRLVGGS